MKRFTLVIGAMLLVAGCTTVHRLDSTKFEVIPVPGGIRNTNKLQEVAQRVTNGVPVIFKVGSGEQLPFKLAMDLPVGKLENAEYTFTFNRDTYFLISQKSGLELSPDGQRWASVASPKGLAKLFGFKHGAVCFGFSSGTNDRPFMNLEVKVK